ncbi:hypothetical protein TrLO_g15628 [Triparma laevis f. longispina]|uniref:ApaG domain-containing protein n=1 Tax=Triparma laevis f. longispina TaxID=1714387 RepID=A0A9W7KYK7_9STRA|nr:hypothetical protein TrLO_g15628 [Triparma laevis f. longispina]
MTIALHDLPVLHHIILYLSPTPFLSVLSKSHQQWWKENGDASVSCTFLSKLGVKIMKRNGATILLREVSKFLPALLPNLPSPPPSLPTYLLTFDFPLYISLINLFHFYATTPHFPSITDVLEHKMGGGLNSIITKLNSTNLTLTNPKKVPPLKSSILLFRLLTSYTSGSISFSEMTGKGNAPLLSSYWGTYLIYNHCVCFHPISNGEATSYIDSDSEWHFILKGKGSHEPAQPLIVVDGKDGKVWRLNGPDGVLESVLESDSLREFVDNFRRKLENGKLFESTIIDNMRGINLSIGGITETTEGINVNVKAFRCIENPQMGFVYCVSIWGDSTFTGSAKLTYRNWVFEDEDGQQETVRGEGVIGMFPEILGEKKYKLDDGEVKEGFFWYWSCTGSREGGRMSGFLEFEKGGVTVKANVGDVILDCNARLFS